MAAAANIVTPTTATIIGQTQIRAHIPVILDMGKMNYDMWRILFETHCLSFTVLGHLDGTSTPPTPTDKDWHQIDGTIKMWIYGTLSESLLASVLKTQCTAHELWLTLENLFRDNKEARAIQLDNEIRTLQIGDLPVHDYCQKLKSLSDLLTNVNAPITERTLVMHLLNRLSPKFDNIINVIKHRSPPCSFNDARSMLKDEEDRLKTQRRPDVSHTDTASSPHALLASSPQHMDNRNTSPSPYYQNNRGGGRNNRGHRGGGRGNRGRSNQNRGNWNPSNTSWPNQFQQQQWPNPPWPIYSQWPNMPTWPNPQWPNVSNNHQRSFNNSQPVPNKSHPAQGILGQAPSTAGSAYLTTAQSSCS